MENNKEFQLTKENLNRAKLAIHLCQFAQQKPGFDMELYYDRKDFRRDYYEYKKFADKNRKLRVEEIHAILHDVPARMVIYYFSQFRFHVKNENMELDYVVGQYFPTEYQQQFAQLMQDLKYAREVS